MPCGCRYKNLALFTISREQSDELKGGRERKVERGKQGVYKKKKKKKKKKKGEKVKLPL
jgi:hypothetical protein